MPQAARVEIRITDLPAFCAFLNNVDVVLGTLEHGTHLDTQEQAAGMLRDAISDLKATIGTRYTLVRVPVAPSPTSSTRRRPAVGQTHMLAAQQKGER